MKDHEPRSEGHEGEECEDMEDLTCLPKTLEGSDNVRCASVPLVAYLFMTFYDSILTSQGRLPQSWCFVTDPKCRGVLIVQGVGFSLSNGRFASCQRLFGAASEFPGS